MPGPPSPSWRGRRCPRGTRRDRCPRRGPRGAWGRQSSRVRARDPGLKGATPKPHCSAFAEQTLLDPTHACWAERRSHIYGAPPVCGLCSELQRAEVRLCSAELNLCSFWLHELDGSGAHPKGMPRDRRRLVCGTGSELRPNASPPWLPACIDRHSHFVNVETEALKWTKWLI